MKNRSDAKFGISTNMIHTAIGPSALFRCDTKRTRIFNVRISNGGKSSTTRSQRRKGCTVLNVVPQISKGPLVVNAVDRYIYSLWRYSRPKGEPVMNLLFALIIWFGQTAVPPVFEVASIKEVRAPSSVENTLAGQVHIGINIDGSRADYGFMSLADLIPYAYRVKRYQVSGPSWMIETRWDILAKIPQGQSADRAPEMMQDLLAERFKLSIHRENRVQSVYALVVGKGGLKIKEAAAKEEAAAPQPAGLGLRMNNDGKAAVISGRATGTMRLNTGPNGGMQMEIAKITMAALADRLTQFMDRPVVDATKLKGNYQVTL